MKKKSVVAKLVKAGQKALRLCRYLSNKARQMRANLGFGVMPLRRKQVPWAAETLRSHGLNSRASQVRHLVLSVPKDTPRREAIRLLYEVFHDWRMTYAPDRKWVAAFHDPCHLHAAVENVGEDGKPLRIQPHQVKNMAAMTFTSKAISARGRGKSKGISVYPHAKKLVVRDLAALLVDESGAVKDDVWDRLVSTGAISGLRSRKDGSLISFEFGGRRIRLATLKHFLPEQPTSTTGTTMPVNDIKTDQPLPDSLADSLLHAGFSKRDLAALNSDLQTLHLADQATREQARTKDKSITKNTPKR